MGGLDAGTASFSTLPSRECFGNHIRTLDRRVDLGSKLTAGSAIQIGESRPDDA